MIILFILFIRGIQIYTLDVISILNSPKIEKHVNTDIPFCKNKTG